MSSQRVSDESHHLLHVHLVDVSQDVFNAFQILSSMLLRAQCPWTFTEAGPCWWIMALSPLRHLGRGLHPASSLDGGFSQLWSGSRRFLKMGLLEKLSMGIIWLFTHLCVKPQSSNRRHGYCSWKRQGGERVIPGIQLTVGVIEKRGCKVKLTQAILFSSLLFSYPLIFPSLCCLPFTRCNWRQSARTWVGQPPGHKTGQKRTENKYR